MFDGTEEILYMPFDLPIEQLIGLTQQTKLLVPVRLEYYQKYCDINFYIKLVTSEIVVELLPGQSKKNQYILIPRFLTPDRIFPDNPFPTTPSQYEFSSLYFGFAPYRAMYTPGINTFVLVYSPDASPMQEYYEMDLGWYMIPIENDDLFVPYRKTQKNMVIVVFVLKILFIIRALIHSSSIQ